MLRSKEFNAGRDAVGRGFMEEMYKVLGKKDMDERQRGELEDMLGQLYLSALPDLSWAKHGIHRKGIAGQALGFSPSEVRLAQEGKSAIYQADQKLVKRRGELMRHYSMAKVTGDEEAAGEAKDAIQGFSEVNPERRINTLQMAASVRTRRKQIEESEQGNYLPKKRRDAMEAGRFAASE